MTSLEFFVTLHDIIVVKVFKFNFINQVVTFDINNNEMLHSIRYWNVAIFDMKDNLSPLAFIFIISLVEWMLPSSILSTFVPGADLRNLCRYAKSCSEKKFPRAFSCCRGRSPF